MKRFLRSKTTNWPMKSKSLYSSSSHTLNQKIKFNSWTHWILLIKLCFQIIDLIFKKTFNILFYIFDLISLILFIKWIPILGLKNLLMYICTTISWEVFSFDMYLEIERVFFWRNKALKNLSQDLLMVMIAC